MLRRTLKIAWYNRNRYALTLLAIALAVAFIVATLLLTFSISNVGEPLTSAYGDVDVVVSGPEVAEAAGPAGATIAPVDPEVLASLTDAGFDVVGLLDPYAQVLNAAGDPAGQDVASSNIAVPWLGDSPLNAYTLSAGAAPLDQASMLLDTTTAQSAGLEIGDTVTVITGLGANELTLTGLVEFGGQNNAPYKSTVMLLADNPVFDVVSGVSGAGYDRLLVAGADVSTVAGLVDSGLIVQSGTAWAAAQAEDLNAFLGFFEIFLVVFAAVAIIVGSVIVANTFTVSMAQRTQELALFRLIGSTQRQLTGQVVVEALILGIAGTFVGLVLGVWGVGVLDSVLDSAGFTIERNDSLAPTALIVGVVVGVGVTVASSILPARKASAVPPIEALRTVDVEPAGASRRRQIIGSVGCGFGLVLLGLGAIQGSAIITGVGIFLLFVGLYFMGETLIHLAGKAAAPLFNRAGPPGLIASRNLSRNASRTAAASSALMIGVALVSFFTLMASTIGEFTSGDADTELTADVVVQGVGSFPEASVTDAMVAAIEGVDGVETVVPVDVVAVGDVTSAAQPDGAGGGPGGSGVGIVDAGLLPLVYDFNVLDGSLDAINGSVALVAEDLANRLDVVVGDTLTVQTQTGPTPLEVGVIVKSALPGLAAPSIIVDQGGRDPFGVDQPATYVYVASDGDVSDAVDDAIDTPTINALGRDQFLDGLSSNLDSILGLIYALLAVAIVIALVGIANTVTLAISEREGEIAAVRATGANRAQVFWSLMSEFTLLAAVGVLSGLVLAYLAALGFFRAISDGQIAWPNADPVTGIVIAALGVGAGAAAALLPSRAASRRDILDVLRAE